MSIYEIPLSRRRTCYYCSCIMDSGALGNYQLATGWVENRKGGGSHITLTTRRADTYACHDCIDKLRHGIPTGQIRLFELPEPDEP